MRVIYREPLTRVDFNFSLLRRDCAQSGEIIEAANLFFQFPLFRTNNHRYTYILKKIVSSLARVCSRIHGWYGEEIWKDLSFRGPFVDHRTGSYPLTRVANGNKRPMQRADSAMRVIPSFRPCVVY